jgi:hypothetical protein
MLSVLISSLGVFPIKTAAQNDHRRGHRGDQEESRQRRKHDAGGSRGTVPDNKGPSLKEADLMVAV